MTYFDTTVVSDAIVATNQQITATLKRQPVRWVETSAATIVAAAVLSPV